MSVLIKGMEMPKSCMDCDFQDVYTNRDGDDEFTCELTWSFTLDYFDQRDGRLPTCPLVELPPHGDLIDRDKYEVFSYTGTEGRPDTFDDGIMFMLDRLGDAPVIVEAEEEEWM